MRSITTPSAERFKGRNLGTVFFVLLAVGGISLVVALAAGLMAPQGSELRRQVAFSWMFGFLYFFSMLAGVFFWILVHHTTDSGWGIVVRRQMENLATVLPWVFLFFIPVILFRHDLWNWIAALQHPSEDPSLRDKLGYFVLQFGTITIPFFWLRAVLYFFFFTFATFYFRRMSVRQDTDGDPKHSIQMRGVSFVCLLLFAAFLTLVAFDWFSSLDYHWASTMWGVYVFAGAAGAGMALLIIVVFALQKAGYLAFVNEEHYHIMGKLLFTFTIFWGYIGFSQYMLIWYSNIPEETTWFLRRNIGSWHTLSTALVVGRFFIPFLYLLFQYFKRDTRFLVPICFWVLAMHILDIYVIVLPFMHPAGFQVNIFDLLSLLAIGCPLAFIFLVRLSGASLFPTRDPRLLESLKLSN
jgi:hypothetical protein